MKRNHFISTFIAALFFLSTSAFAQSYSTWFTNPTDGSITNGGTSSPYSVHFTFGWSGQKQNSYNTWRFEIISLNQPVNVLPKATSNYFTDENSPFFDITYYTLGEYEAELKMYERDWATGNLTLRATASITFNIGVNITVSNIFGGGIVSVNDNTVSSGTSYLIASGQSLDLSALNQSYGGYSRVWNTSGTNNSSWNENELFLTLSPDYLLTASSSDNGATLTAGLRTVYNPVFQNSFGSGMVYLDGSQYSSGSSIPKVEQNSVTANAPYQVINGIEYTFNHWQDNNTSNPRSIQINGDATYTAYYTGKPTNSGEYPYCSSAVGQPITISWNDNVNTAVTQYQIWRRVKHNGVTGPEQLLGTVGRGVESYTDNAYFKTASYVDLIFYDVRAYYSTEGTHSDPDYFAVYGESNLRMSENNSAQVEIAKELPRDYAVSNYPNPFNPATKISYQLPENGLVTISVYDILGKEVAELVNGFKQAGYYEVNFDANKLTSGIYIYTIQANNFVQSKKMLLMK